MNVDLISPRMIDAGDLRTAIEIEEAIITGLVAAYNTGDLEYLHFSPAYDVTAARMLAARKYLDAMESLDADEASAQPLQTKEAE